MNWGFDVPNGDYDVRLYFGEQTSTTINDIGGRVFDVALEGNDGPRRLRHARRDQGTKGVALEGTSRRSESAMGC